MRATWLTVILGAVLALPGTAQQGPRPHLDRKLQASLEQLASSLHGVAGIYVQHLPSGRFAAVNADQVFPTASMIKLPILVTLFQEMEDGRLRWRDTLTYRDSLAYSDEDDLLAKVKDKSPVPLSQVGMLMITTSDNTAALWLQALVGTGTAINGWLARHGFDSTRVNSRTPGRESARTMYGWGQTTPREMATLLLRVRQEHAVGPAADQEMYRILTRSYWNGEALSQLPPWVQAASKQGMVDRSRSEVVLVNAPSGDYVFCVITKEQEDESWKDDNEGYVLIRRVSALLWSTFEPRHPWTPAPGAQRFKP